MCLLYGIPIGRLRMLTLDQVTVNLGVGRLAPIDPSSLSKLLGYSRQVK